MSAFARPVSFRMLSQGERSVLSVADAAEEREALVPEILALLVGRECLSAETASRPGFCTNVRNKFSITSFRFGNFVICCVTIK